MFNSYTCHDHPSQVWHLGGRLPAALGGLLAGRDQRRPPRDVDEGVKSWGKTVMWTPEDRGKNHGTRYLWKIPYFTQNRCNNTMENSTIKWRWKTEFVPCAMSTRPMRHEMEWNSLNFWDKPHGPMDVKTRENWWSSKTHLGVHEYLTFLTRTDMSKYPLVI